MRAEDWFALSLRVIGAVVSVYGMGYLLDSLLFWLGYFNFPESSPNYYVVVGIAYVIAGVFLLRAAPLLVRFAYPEEEEDEDEEDDAGDKQDDRQLIQRSPCANLYIFFPG